MQSVTDYIQQNYDRYLQELHEFCAIPSVSTRSEYKKDIIRCLKRYVARAIYRLLPPVAVTTTESLQDAA